MMTDVLMTQSRVNKLESYTSNNTSVTPATNNVFGSSSVSSSSCEETESVCSETHAKINPSEEVDSDDNLDDYDKLMTDDQNQDNEDGDMDEDDASVSSKAYSTCSSSKPVASGLGAGNRRKQNKPIRIQEEEKNLKLKKNATDISIASSIIENSQTTFQQVDEGQLLTHLPSDQIISAEIADLLISNKLDQISPATAARLLQQEAALENNHIPKINQVTKPPQVMNPNSTFCTICKKEVCNKYFFKTHLMNKHNITLEDYLAGNIPQLNNKNTSSIGSLSSASSSSSSSSSSTSSIYETNATKTENMSPSKQLAALASILGQKPAISKKKVLNEYDEESDMTNQTEAILSLLNLSKQQQNTPTPDSTNSELFTHYFNLAMRQQQQAMPGLDSLLGENFATPASATANEDYCNICQKQFCNKYYLKKHRIDVHGLGTTDSPVTVKSTHTPVAVQSKKDTLDVETVVKNLLPSLASTDALNSANLTQILINQLNPLMQIVQNSPSPTISSASASSISSSKIKSETEPVVSTIGGKGASVSVLDKVEPSAAEVTCPHCEKVFYSTEFLALHIQNKHAGKMNLDKENSSVLETTSAKISQLINRSSLQSQHDSPALANQPFCQYCNKSFCNKYFLKTHMNKAHGKTLIIENNRTEGSLGAKQDDGESPHFASKVVDRVVCDICNKQVCNKYFLRTHKLRVHGAVDARKSLNNDSYNMENANNSEYYDYYMDDDEQNELGEHAESDEDEECEMRGRMDEEGEVRERMNEEGGMQEGTDEEGEVRGNLEQSVSGNGVDVGEMYQKIAEAAIKEQQMRRPSTSSESSSLSVLTTSSAYTGGPLKVVPPGVAQAHYGSVQSPGSVSSVSVNSPMSGDQIKKENEENNQPNLNSPASAMDRVKCLMCEKEVCNKYFLRQHVQTRHKITFEEYIEAYGIHFQRKNARNPNSVASPASLAVHILNQKTKINKLPHRNSTGSQVIRPRSTVPEPDSTTRKRKFSNASSRSETESYDTVSSSSNFKKSRQTTDEILFSDQLLRLTNSAEEQGFSDLQAFIVEADEECGEFQQYFRPSMIYLPVQTKLNDSISLRVRLRPVEQIKSLGDLEPSVVNKTNNILNEVDNQNNNNSINNEDVDNDFSLGEDQKESLACDEEA